MKKSLICLITVCMIFFVYSVSPVFGFTAVDYVKRAEGLADCGVTAYQDESVIKNEKSETIYPNDPLADYELAAFLTTNLEGETYYLTKYNFYNITERFGSGNNEFSFTLGQTSGDIHILYKGEIKEIIQVSKVPADGWHFEILDEVFSLTIGTDKNGTKFATVKLAVDVINATYDTSLCKVTVNSYIPKCGGGLVTIALLGNENPRDIGYVEIVPAKADDRLSFAFNFLGDISKYTLNVSYDGIIRKVPLTIIDTGCIPEADISAKYNSTDKKVTVKVEGNEAFYGTNEACRIIIAYYSVDNSLKGFYISKSWESSLTRAVPEDTAVIRCFTWNSISKMVPLTLAQEIKLVSAQ